MKLHSFDLITKLEPNQVFVFGSNLSGFHGAGSAGYAFKGTAANDWKINAAFLRAKESPVGSPHRIGKWAIYGQGKGFMRGKEGASYGIVTTDRPGYKGDTTLETITKEVEDLASFATQHPELEFLCSPFGLSRKFGGFSWFSLDELQNMYETLDNAGKLPSNLLIHSRFKREPELTLGL